MFQPKDFVVYPAQGVGQIERIDHKTIGGVACEMYIVRIINSNVTLMVPLGSSSNTGLRKLIGKKQAQNVLKTLLKNVDETVYAGQNWNRRFREYSEKLKSPDPNEVAIVARELLLINRGKELSFGERRLLEQALSLVVGELSIVLGKPDHELKDTIQTAYTPPAPPENA